MICNRTYLLAAPPIKNMLSEKKKFDGYSHGMSEAGYDIRIAEDIHFFPKTWRRNAYIKRWNGTTDYTEFQGNFCLASTFEEFQMPSNLVGVVHDKSTWARRGLSVFNTVIEPGWNGFLTLELVFNGSEPIKISYGTGIAQVIFHETRQHVTYEGKYQNAGAGPQEAILT